MRLLSVSACSIGSSPPSAPRPRTWRNHASPWSGGSSWMTSVVLATPLTWCAHWSRRFDTSAPAGIGAVNGVPSRLATKASPTSAALRITGGVAGRSSFSPASRAMASTTAPITSRVTVRGSLRDSTDTGPGMAPASRRDLGVVDARRGPAHVEVHHLALGVAVGAEARDDAALRHEPHRRDRDAAEPADAGAHAVLVALTAADRDDEPAERLLDGDRQRGGLQPVRERRRRRARPSRASGRRAPRAGRRGRRSGGRRRRDRRPTRRSSPPPTTPGGGSRRWGRRWG